MAAAYVLLLEVCDLAFLPASLSPMLPNIFSLISKEPWRSLNSGLVHQVFEVGTGETKDLARHLFQIHIDTKACS